MNKMANTELRKRLMLCIKEYSEETRSSVSLFSKFEEIEYDNGKLITYQRADATGLMEGEAEMQG